MSFYFGLQMMVKLFFSSSLRKAQPFNIYRTSAEKALPAENTNGLTFMAKQFSGVFSLSRTVTFRLQTFKGV